jgi:hypothetical protein
VEDRYRYGSLINMLEEIKKIESLIFKASKFGIVNMTKDKECRDYFGCNFQLGSQHIKFRKAKLTPKKIGQFVTLWKRNYHGQTVPYDLDDDFNFHIILAEFAHQSGFFVFPKEILARMGILTSCDRDGKRGFRVYPEWDVPITSQGTKTKEWQQQYFIEINDEKNTIEKLQRILMPIYSPV